MSKPARRGPPTTLGEWRARHSEHGRPFFDVKIGVYHVYRCSCGERTTVEETLHGRGDNAPIPPSK